MEADAEFHRRLFEPLNNELLLNLLGVFWKVYRKIHIEVGPVPRTWPARRRRCTGTSMRPWRPGTRRVPQELTRHFDGIRRRISEAVGDSTPADQRPEASPPDARTADGVPPT